jgi:molecular chaperone DnaK (HSP70)
LRYGFDALRHQPETGWHILRSFKRELASHGPQSIVHFGENQFTVLELLTGFLRQLRDDLLTRSNLRIKKSEALEAMISVPANANSNQRYLTIEAFKGAGFGLRGTINEPSAAGIEYAHHHLLQTGATAEVGGGAAATQRENVVVYDLGGGTFDASLISMAERKHEVISSQGISHLGGDDFDAILLNLTLERSGLPDDLPAEARRTLHDECREKKEALHPNTRKIVIDLEQSIPGGGEVIIATSDFYERARPLVERTIEAMEQMMIGSRLDGVGQDWRSVAAVYLVGGASDLPIVARTLRERFGRQVRKSPYPHASAAIGLAIAADTTAGYALRERFTRHFGVWREEEHGRRVSFDVLFEKDTLLPSGAGEKLKRERSYRPAHNIGHYRFLESSRLDEKGHPVGDITLWDEIAFPYDSALQDMAGVTAGRKVERNIQSEKRIEESYVCDQHGIIEVNIADLNTGYRQSYQLRMWSGIP